MQSIKNDIAQAIATDNAGGLVLTETFQSEICLGATVPLAFVERAIADSNFGAVANAALNRSWVQNNPGNYIILAELVAIYINTQNITENRRWTTALIVEHAAKVRNSFRSGRNSDWGNHIDDLVGF